MEVGNEPYLKESSVKIQTPPGLLPVTIMSCNEEKADKKNLKDNTEKKLNNSSFENKENVTDQEQLRPQISNGLEQKNSSCSNFSSSIVHEELQYLNLIKQVLSTGADKSDRTGVGTLSIFGTQMKFSLREGVLPLFTTKRVSFKNVLRELLWFIRGSTNSKELSQLGVKIWDKNSSREFLDNQGFTDREEGDLGPVYGFQWRHYGAKYESMNSDYSGKGIDQLKNVINTILTNPNDRRMIVCAWNPADLNQMALPPCHCFFQFYVANGELSCQFYQRSADLGLGVPYNVASYAILTHMIATITGLKPGDLIHTMGDCHIYKNHIDALKKQILRTPREFPKLVFTRSVSNIDDFKEEDFSLINYDPHPIIKMDMAV